MSLIYKIEGRFLEFNDDFVIDREAYPYAEFYTREAMEAEIAQSQILTEEQKKANLKFDIRTAIASFDYVFLGDTEFYISDEDKEEVRAYRRTLRNILNDWASLNSTQITALIPTKPTIKHNKVQ